MLTDRQREQTAKRQREFRKRQQAARESELRARGLPALPVITTMPGTARWKAAITAAEALVSQTLTEMEAYRDDRSERWADSEACANHTEREDALTEIAENLQSVLYTF
jgi:hypothetical protein